MKRRGNEKERKWADDANLLLLIEKCRKKGKCSGLLCGKANQLWFVLRSTCVVVLVTARCCLYIHKYYLISIRDN